MGPDLEKVKEVEKLKMEQKNFFAHLKMCCVRATGKCVFAKECVFVRSCVHALLCARVSVFVCERERERERERDESVKTSKEIVKSLGNVYEGK